MTKSRNPYINLVTSEATADDKGGKPLDSDGEKRAKAGGHMQKPHEKWMGIRAQMLTKGYTLARLADELGVSQQAVSDVRHRPNARIQAAIAELLGVSPASLFPDRYTSDGDMPINQVMRSKRVKHTAAQAAGNV